MELSVRDCYWSLGDVSGIDYLNWPGLSFNCLKQSLRLFRLRMSFFIPVAVLENCFWSASLCSVRDTFFRRFVCLALPSLDYVSDGWFSSFFNACRQRRVLQTCSYLGCLDCRRLYCLNITQLSLQLLFLGFLKVSLPGRYVSNIYTSSSPHRFLWFKWSQCFVNHHDLLIFLVLTPVLLRVNWE